LLSRHLDAVQPIWLGDGKYQLSVLGMGMVSWW